MIDLPPALFTRLRRLYYHRAQRNARIRNRLDLVWWAARCFAGAAIVTILVTFGELFK